MSQDMLQHVMLLFTTQRLGDAGARTRAQSSGRDPASPTTSGAFWCGGDAPRAPRARGTGLAPGPQGRRSPSGLRPPAAAPGLPPGGRGCRLWPESFGF